MAAKGYCTSDDVMTFLGREFTGPQKAHCDTLIERAESDFDEETNRGWLMGAQTDEAIRVDSQNIFLRYAPVATVTTVKGRAGLGETDETLTADTDYEIINLEYGHIRLVYPGNYDRLLVSYTPTDTVPGLVTQAMVEIVANLMQPHLNQGVYGIDSYALPDLSVKFSRSHVQQSYPPYAQRVIDRLRYVVHD